MSVIRELALSAEDYQVFRTGGYVHRVLGVYRDGDPEDPRTFVLYEFSDDGPAWRVTLHLQAIAVGQATPGNDYTYVGAVRDSLGFTLWYVRRQLRRADEVS